MTIRNTRLVNNGNNGVVSHVSDYNKTKMDKITLPTLTRIPGGLPTLKTERPVEDLTKLTKPQLLELRDRQLKLLENKQRIAKLPDKGARIQGLYDRILKELTKRDEIQEAADLFSDLNIASKGKEKLTTLEWTGKLENPDQGEAVLDSDDDEEIDPLKIIAQGCAADKVVKYIKPEKSLITEQDLKEIESFEREKFNGSVCSETSSTASAELEPHALYVMEKNIDHLPTVEKFKPYKTTKSNVHDPAKEMMRKQNKNWENTAATPPVLMHPGTKMLSLQESVEIQTEYQQRLKEIQEKQAQERIERLAKRPHQPGILLPDEAARKLSKFFGAYRQDHGNESDSDSEQPPHPNETYSDEEVVDDVEDRGGVVFTVSS